MSKRLGDLTRERLSPIHDFIKHAKERVGENHGSWGAYEEGRTDGDQQAWAEVLDWWEKAGWVEAKRA